MDYFDTIISEYRKEKLEQIRIKKEENILGFVFIVLGISLLALILF